MFEFLALGGFPCGKGWPHASQVCCDNFIKNWTSLCKNRRKMKENKKVKGVLYVFGC